MRYNKLNIYLKNAMIGRKAQVLRPREPLLGVKRHASLCNNSSLSRFAEAFVVGGHGRSRYRAAHSQSKADAAEVYGVSRA